jgi:predicted dehydrogenase
VDTHVTGILHHTSGALSTITTSFDAVRTTAAPIEVHGETGSLAVPDPNLFAGEVRLFALGADQWRTVPPSAGYADAARGIGLLDMLTAPAPRADGALALHVLDAMTALLRSAGEGHRVELTTTTQRPEPVPLTAASAWRR